MKRVQNIKFKRYKRYNVKSHLASLLRPPSQPDQQEISRDRDSASTQKVLGIRREQFTRCDDKCGKIQCLVQNISQGAPGWLSH